MKRNDDRRADDVDEPLAQPTGPHHGHVDEAAGGADSSPFETEPSGGQEQQAPPAEEWGERIATGKQIARGGKDTHAVPGATEQRP